MSKRRAFLIFSLLIASLTSGASSGEWLGEGSQNYADARSWFSDPIFYSGPGSPRPSSYHEQYYPYFGAGFFADSGPPVRLGSTTAATRFLPFSYLYSPITSDFRNRSLANMQWSEFNKNWTSTVSFAKSKSSFRVRNKGEWTNI